MMRTTFALSMITFGTPCTFHFYTRYKLNTSGASPDNSVKWLKTSVIILQIAVTQSVHLFRNNSN